MELREQIEQILNEDEGSRNSDITLTIKLWQTFYPEKLLSTASGDAVRLENLYVLPREDNIKRIRAKIQNEEWRFLPTELSVVKARRMNENKWRESMGYATKEEDIEYDPRILAQRPLHSTEERKSATDSFIALIVPEEMQVEANEFTQSEQMKII